MKIDKKYYNRLHKWIRNNKQKPEFCEVCGLKKPFDATNISGQYKWDLEDFKWLCRSCHKILDYKKRRKKFFGKIECLNCKKMKLKEDFFKDNCRWDGFSTWCKTCYKENYPNIKDRKNKRRRKRYANDENYRKKMIEQAKSNYFKRQHKK